MERNKIPKKGDIIRISRFYLENIFEYSSKNVSRIKICLEFEMFFNLFFIFLNIF